MFFFHSLLVNQREKDMSLNIKGNIIVGFPLFLNTSLTGVPYESGRSREHHIHAVEGPVGTVNTPYN